KFWCAGRRKGRAQTQAPGGSVEFIVGRIRATRRPIQATHAAHKIELSVARSTCMLGGEGRRHNDGRVFPGDGMTNSPFTDGAGYVRGRFVPIAEATLPVTDWGFARSDAVYDVVHVFKGGFFRLADHLDRFERSMQMRRIHPPEDRAAIETVLHRCVALTGFADAYVAMVASRGRPRGAGSPPPAGCENHLIAYALPWIDVVPRDVQARGAHVFIASTPRVPDA